jgi:hypothetical protein
MGHLPTLELVIRDGTPVWLIQCEEVAAEHQDRRTAAQLFTAQCQSRGLRLPDGGAQPRRGPSEVDEPGV